MAYVLPSLLQPAIVNERVNQLKVVDNVLQTHMGIQAGGPNVRQTPSRRGSVDVFNDTRIISAVSLPGTPANVVAPNPVGNYAFQIPRINDSIPLPGEMLSQLRPIGGPVSSVDSSGMQYIADQERYLKRQITCFREFQAAAVLRGSYSFSNSGGEYGGVQHAFTGGSITVNYQIPSGNKTQLNMLGAGNILTAGWQTASTQIVTHILNINAAFIQLTGQGLADMWITSVVWNYIQNNTQVQTLAGSANTYYETIDRDLTTQNFVVVLKAIPWLRIHVTDNGLTVNGSFTKLVDDTAAAFTIPLTSDVVHLYECGEPVSEWQGMPSVFRYGEYYWITPTFNPTGYQLFNLFNGLPIVNVPKGIAYATVNF